MPRSLIKLALEGSDEARRRLFAQLSELMTAKLEERTDRELAIFSEVILKLYAFASAKDRARLAQKLATHTSLPHPLACRMAEDDLSIAMPILASCPVLTQDDLLDFVERLSKAHLQVIARRTDLSPGVSDRLVEKGDTPVQRILAGNREIELSRATMLKLVRLAAEDTVLREDLALRSDLPPSVCRSLLPLVDSETKKRLHRMIEGALSQVQLNQIARLKILRREFGLALENPDMNVLWRDAQRAHITFDELVILLLQDNRFNHTIELLAMRVRTEPRAFKDAVFNGEKEAVAETVAKAGLSPAVFAMFAKSRCEHLKLPASQASQWIAAYSGVLSRAGREASAPRSDFQARRKNRREKPAGRRSLRHAAGF
ncbi:DUF2336 domain-containing protein [Roseibium aggregatum]|uniref:DUF2336 domain-containing protein n=1 Tax=Roseibium aggregatum TaxID=187304 RepID=A0A939J2T1_9HYPH|nr:DUF2336 domain-containing protein [Roseibium aggregatum]MBN9671743.1 DUF2336 domain-containing protein [Roseibium aggregatum]